MRDLSRLLKPNSLAVIGGGWGIAVVEQARRMGFRGDIWPVHPSRTQMCGLPCFPSLDDLPAAPDAAFVAVNRHLTIEAIAKLSAMGAGGAVCFASGFAEAEGEAGFGADLQAQLVKAAGEMPVLGPNCYGLINYLDGALLWPDQHGGTDVGEGVAIIGQSSNILINLTMQKRGLPLAYVLAAGNQAQIGLAEMAMAVMEDPRVTAVGLHIEGVGDVRAFEAMAALGRKLGKPIVALKVGRSAEAQAATISHTASLAGGDAASRAFLKRLGIAETTTLPAFVETLKLCHVHGPLPGRAVSSMSCSGGEAGLIADAALGKGVRFRPLTDPEHDRIKATLSDLVTVANPLDYHTFIWNDPPRMTETYAAVFDCGFDLNFLVYDLPRTDRAEDGAWECGISAVIAATARTGARVAVVASLAENLPEARAAQLMAAGIAPLMGLDEALSAASAAADIAEAWQGDPPMPVVLGRGECAPAADDAGTAALTEGAAKAALAAHGVSVPAGRMARSPEEVGRVATELGFPVVLKGQGIAHKTEAGAVHVGLMTREAVAQAAAAMAGVSGFLVERMVADAVAELIVGVVRDPVYGFALTLGAGGILTEVLQDSATILIPATETEIRDALAGLRVARLLEGYRGKPAADLDAVVAAVLAVQRYVEATADQISDQPVELDINPLICTPTEAVAADALIRLSSAPSDD